MWVVHKGIEYQSCQKEADCHISGRYQFEIENPNDYPDDKGCIEVKQGKPSNPDEPEKQIPNKPVVPTPNKPSEPVTPSNITPDPKPNGGGITPKPNKPSTPNTPNTTPNRPSELILRRESNLSSFLLKNIIKKFTTYYYCKLIRRRL